VAGVHRSSPQGRHSQESFAAPGSTLFRVPDYVGVAPIRALFSATFLELTRHSLSTSID
jgi:hypothetical protein